jgi:ABC-2 type transport system permease protein
VGAFFTIVRHEVRQTRRDGRFVALAVSMGVLLALALLTGWRDATEHRRTVEQAQTEQRQRWLEMIAMPPHLAAHAGTMVFRPWPSLAALDPGVNAETGTAIFLEAHKRNFFDHRPAEDDQLPTLFPRMSVAVLLQGLVPLLVLIAAPSLVAFEREHGIWRLALSAGVNAHTLAAGKAIGAALPVAALLVPVAAVAGWLGVLGPADLTDAPSRTVVLAIAYLGYYVIILFIALGISALASSSKQALGAACAAWMLFVLVVPRLGQEIAQASAPAPSARAFTEEILTAQSQHPDFSTRQDAIVSRLKAEFGVTREIDLPISPYGLTLYEGEEEETRAFQARFERLFGIYAAQQRIIRTASFSSPTIAIEAVSSAMAGTDWAHQQDFAEHAEMYRRVLVQTLNRALADGGAARQYEDASTALYAAVPPFEYEQPSLPFALAHARAPIAVIGAWAAVSALLAMLAVRRCAGT